MLIRTYVAGTQTNDHIMLGSMDRERNSSGRLKGQLKGRVYRYGKRVECEICESVTQCMDRYGMVTCQTCQSELLPSSGGVLYRG